MEKGFPNAKGRVSGSAMKEKCALVDDLGMFHDGLFSYSAISNGVDEGTTTSSNVATNTQGVKESVDGTVNTEDVNVRQTSTSPTINPKPGTSYANVTAISERFANTAYGFFLGKRVANLVVANNVRNTWGKYGLVRSMLCLSTRFFSFQFSSMDVLDSMLENGSWFIRNNPLILKNWHPDVNLLKEDVDRSRYARAMIELRADVELKYNIVVAMPNITMEGYYTCNIHVEYEWKPPRNSGRIEEKIGFKLTKQVFQPISKKPTANTSGKKKNNAESTKEVSKSNPFEVLTSVENDVELVTNNETSNLASQEAITSGSSFWNVDSGSLSTTPIIEKFDKIEKLIIDGRVPLVDDEGKPLEKVYYRCLSSLKDVVCLCNGQRCGT
ncbi:retrotransposon protein, putative, unclassified [Tanacetum coccineum]